MNWGGGDPDLNFFARVPIMWPQLACDKVCATWVMNPAGLRNDKSHVAVVTVSAFPRAMLRQWEWHRCLVHAARYRTRRRHLALGRFAAMSGNQAAEIEQSKSIRNLDGEGSADLRGEDRLLSSVGTAALAPASFRDWYLADKQLVVVSVVGFAVCFSSPHRRDIQLALLLFVCDCSLNCRISSLSFRASVKSDWANREYSRKLRLTEWSVGSHCTILNISRATTLYCDSYGMSLCLQTAGFMAILLAAAVPSLLVNFSRIEIFRSWYISSGFSVWSLICLF